MVNTLKFSEFKQVDPSTEELLSVGLSDGDNALSSKDLQGAAFKSATDENEDFVASVQGSFTTGHVLLAADSKGTVKDGGNPVGTGTVTQVSSGTGLTGGPINSSGTLSFASIAAESFWANTTGGVAVPTVTALSLFLKASNNLSELTNTDTSFTNLGFGTGLPIVIDDSDFTAGVYQLPVPCPNVVIATITTPGLEIRLPTANIFRSPVLSRGVVIQSVGSSTSVDIAKRSGSVIDTLENTERKFYSLENRSTSDGVWGENRETISVNDKFGIVTLNSDDLTANDNFTPTSYTPEGGPGFDADSITGNLNGINAAIVGVPNINGNLIYAGNFSTNPWQRGTAGFVTNAVLTADRFLMGVTGAGVVEVSKVADSPTVVEAGVFTQDCLNWEVTTADASIAATDLYRIYYKMRGYDFTSIARRAFTLSFWVKATVIGTYCVSFVNSGSDRSYVAEYGINVTDTWEFKSITVSASPSAGTWDYTTGTGLTIGFTISAGSNFQTTPNAWNTGNFASTSSQVNGMATIGNMFNINLIKLEVGSSETPYVNYSLNEVLINCQAEYEKSYNQGIDPATATTDGILAIDVGTPVTADLYLPIVFNTSKNSTPTIVLYDAAGNVGKVTKGADNKTGVSTNIGTHGFSMGCSDLTLSSSLSGHFTASTGY